MVIFLTNIITASAFAACKCEDMVSANNVNAEQIMPCHNVQDVTVDNINMDDYSPNNGEMTFCTKCTCGDCKVPSQAMLDSFSKYSQKYENTKIVLLLNDLIISALEYGIDNPPKYIS